MCPLFFVHVMKGNAMIINNFDDDVSSTFSLSSNNDGMDLSELGCLSRNVLDDFLQDNDDDFFIDEDDIDNHASLMAIFYYLPWLFHS